MRNKIAPASLLTKTALEKELKKTSAALESLKQKTKRTTEEQTRDSQISDALEAVRSRALAMDQSEELKEVVAIVLNKFRELNLQTDGGIALAIFNDETRGIDYWTANSDWITPTLFRTPYFDHPVNNDIRTARNTGSNFLSNTYSFEQKNSWFDFLLLHTDLKNLPEDNKKMIYEGRSMTNAFAISKNSGIGVLTFLGKTFSDEQIGIVKRFAKVFEQAYVRFLDLQKAEGQARESQIQLALEKVRARTMAMQRSDELKYAAALLFQQAKALGVPAYSCGYNIWEKNETAFTSWMSTQDGCDFNAVLNIPLTEDANFIRYARSKREDEPFFVLELRGERMQEHYHYLKTIPEFKAYFDYAVKAGLPIPETQIHHIVNFSHGNLQFITLEPCPAFHEVFKRFAAVFDQTYTRFLDLQKAEGQARESQIQLALERVRARTMAMHQSNELSEAALLLFQQLRDLGLSFWRTGFYIWRKDVDLVEGWVSNGELDGILPSILLSYKEDEGHRSIYEASSRGEESYEKVLRGEELTRHYQWFMSQSNAPETLKHFTDAEFVRPDIQYKYAALFKEGYLLILAKEPQPEAKELLKRFAKIFEQTYTRFLDLKNAEAQVRESKIQLALERVRARTMAMQHSDELAEAAALMFQQVQSFGVSSFSCGFNIWEPDDISIKSYMARPDGTFQVAPGLRLPHTEHPFFIKGYEARKRGEEFLVLETGRKELEETYRYMFSLPDFKKIFDEWKDSGYQIPAFQISHVVFFQQGYLLFITYEAVPEMWDIFKRFGKVFEQTYTRFLDLQKAEAQARESQIQLALERVRARTMAMQRSDELAEAATVLFEQAKDLGIRLWSSGFNIWQSDGISCLINMCNPDGSIATPYLLPHNEYIFFQKILQARQRGDDILVIETGGKELKDAHDYMLSLPQVKKVLVNMRETGNQTPSFQVNHCAFFSQGYLMFITYEPVPEMWDVFKRFAKVFEQTYTRFLDLQKAEAQARESQIEAALERVRSRSMGMQKSEELKDVIQVIHEQLKQLNFDIRNAGFLLDYRQHDDYKIWMSDASTQFPTQKFIPFFDHLFNRDYLDQKANGPELFARTYSFDEKNTWLRELYKYMPEVPVKLREYAFSLPALAVSRVLLNNIGLYVLNLNGTPYSDSENATLIRFGRVFEQTYTRFNDLKQVEAQALEAIKRASVDRVRAEIASMRTTEDLESITPLIWNELTALGVPFVRCGVFIMDEEAQQIHTFLSTPEGQSIATLQVPFDFNLILIRKGVEHWRQKKVYQEHWDKATFIQAWKALSVLHETSISSSQNEQLPEDLYLHLLPFLQGMLYVGSEVPLTDDAMQLSQNLADAFSTAYARYEDFNKLELAKKQIEITLVDLQQAQAQLVQSEKMASLGELTAGIAHEIQNPLNFVNNFSDVNTELVQEAESALDNGKIDVAKSILQDIMNNERKINHHGKRADAIVKGMLQHSRISTGQKEPTDINALADEYLRLSYHGLRAKDKSFNAILRTDFDPSIGKINVIPQEIGRLFLNLYNNAFYAVNEKSKDRIKGYEPAVSVSTKEKNHRISISVRDNGKGMPQKVIDKIFQPFFTTKPTGQGTGLGLSLSYDIVKAHAGEILVETKENEGSEFIIDIPVKQT